MSDYIDREYGYVPATSPAQQTASTETGLNAAQSTDSGEQKTGTAYNDPLQKTDAVYSDSVHHENSYTADATYTAGSYGADRYAAQNDSPYSATAGGQYQGTTGGQRCSYAWQNNGQPPVPPKKHKKGVGMALLMVLCVLCSGLAGFAGSWYANKLSAPQPTVGSTADGTTQDDPAPGRGAAYFPSEEGLSRAALVEKVSPTVVQITTEYTVNNFWMQSVASGAGSGVVITADGTIVTNNHVIDKAEKIQVTLPSGEEYDATLVATDPQTDIAVLKIDAQDLPYATVGDSDQLVVGQDVLVVGNPLGKLGGTVTDGIISAASRQVTVDNYTMTLIQTNAAINPGNSGGGMFDAEGKLIGIVNAKYSDTDVEGLGFAIPINIAMKSAQDLIDVGYVTGRVNVGLNLLSINDQQTAFQYRVSRLGVYVYSTVEGSSAETAGFRTGDYIASVDGKEVSTTEEIKSIFNEHEVGDEVTVHVIRDTEEKDLTLILTEYNPTEEG